MGFHILSCITLPFMSDHQQLNCFHRLLSTMSNYPKSPSKGVQFFQHFQKNFLRPYGAAAEAPTEVPPKKSYCKQFKQWSQRERKETWKKKKQMPEFSAWQGSSTWIGVKSTGSKYEENHCMGTHSVWKMAWQMENWCWPENYSTLNIKKKFQEHSTLKLRPRKENR